MDGFEDFFEGTEYTDPRVRSQAESGKNIKVFAGQIYLVGLSAVGGGR